MVRSVSGWMDCTLFLNTFLIDHPYANYVLNIYTAKIILTALQTIATSFW